MLFIFIAYSAAMFDSDTKELTEQESTFFAKEAADTGTAVSVVQAFWMCDPKPLSVSPNDNGASY